MVRWPNALVAELAERRCIIFMGAGASAGAQTRDGRRPLMWKTFLEKLLDQSRSSTRDRKVIKALLKKNQYLDAAEIIRQHIDIADFDQFIRNEFQIPRYEASPIHKSVLTIDPKIVITTNYDKIYDDYCTSGEASEGYNVCKYYEEHLVSDLRSSIRLIVKAHGCVTDPSKIILTRSEYFTARDKYASFYRVLDSLFLTNTILFLGYSMSDPDIQLVLENATIAAPSTHPHYAIVPRSTHRVISISTSRTYNMRYLEYSPGDYDDVNNSLEILVEEVLSYRAAHPS
jgi:hypothetical protein